jgi:methyl-accepting chemotaxis protein
MFHKSPPPVIIGGETEAKVERFRARSMLALALVCVTAAVAMQVYAGIFIERNLAESFSRAKAFYLLLAFIQAASALWLWLILRPLKDCSEAIAAGKPVSYEEREGARSAADRVPKFVIAVAAASFGVAPALAMGAAGGSGGAGEGPIKIAVFVALDLAFGLAAGFQATILLRSILRKPLVALGFGTLSKDRKRRSLANQIVIAGGISAALLIVFTGAAGYAALAASEPPEASGFLLELLGLAFVMGLWSVSLFRTLGRTLAARAADVGELVRLVSVGEGDLSTRIPIVQDDEVSAIAAAFNHFLERLSGLTDRVRELSSSVEEGANKLSGSAEHATASVSGLVGSVEATRAAVQRQMETVSSTEGEISSLLESIGQVAAKVGDQSGFMDQSSAAVSEMAANIASVSRTAEKADELATALQKASEDGGEALRASIGSIAEIAEASRAVRDIIGSISKIAAQTNLLAMNAAIEAAHAGEAGSGFAVVADEVRSLAENSARSAREIELLIRGMAEKTDRGAALGDLAGKAFERIREGVAQTSELVRTIAASMGEQREGAEDILRSSQSLADATRLIESLAEGQKSQSQEMEQSMLRIVSASNEIFEAVQEETGATQALGRIVAMVGEEAGRNRERVLGLEEAVSRFKTGAAR